MKSPDTQKNNVDSEAISGMLKRIIAENGRDHIWGYAVAITCLILVALSTAYIAYIMKWVIDKAFVDRNLVDAWLICGSCTGTAAASVLAGAA